MQHNITHAKHKTELQPIVCRKCIKSQCIWLLNSLNCRLIWEVSDPVLSICFWSSVCLSYFTSTNLECVVAFDLHEPIVHHDICIYLPDVCLISAYSCIGCRVAQKSEERLASAYLISHNLLLGNSFDQFKIWCTALVLQYTSQIQVNNIDIAHSVIMPKTWP